MTCRSSTTRPAVINFKVVYYGPGLAGKTANLQHIHQCLPDGNKGKMISLATGDDRTLFFDFLPVSALGVRGFTTRFQLYTVPGQMHYNMTRKLVLRGVDGVVFVADSQWDRLRDNVESFRNLDENLKEYGLNLATIPLRAAVQQARPGPDRSGRLHGVSPQPRRAACSHVRGRRRRRDRRVRHLEHGVAPGTRQRIRSSTGGRRVRVHDIVIHEADAVRIDAVLGRFLADSGCAAALLIDRSGQPLAETGVSRTLDTGSIGALAAGAFSATAALARLLGESEFSVLFHEGVRESMHVSTVDDDTILLAIFDERTTVGMVRLFAREASTSIGGILEETRKRPKRVGALAAPLTAEEMRRAGDHRSA